MVKIKASYYSEFGELWGLGLTDLIRQAVANLPDTDDIEAVFFGNMLAARLQGQGHLGALVCEELEKNLPAMVLESACASGGMAVYAGWQAIKAKQYKSVLVLGVEKMTDHKSDEISEALMQAGSLEERVNGATFPALYALVAQAYLNKYNLDAGALDEVSIKAHTDGINDPKAQYNFEIDSKKIADSRNVASPLKLLHCSPISDGVAALVLSQNEGEIEIKDIKTAVSCKLALADRTNLTSFDLVKSLVLDLYESNQIEAADIDLAEIHDCFAIAQLIAMKDLGFDHDLDVNVRGGLKAGGHAIGATGVKQIAVLHQEMLNNSKYKKALAHNVGGVGTSAVLSLLVNNL